MDSDDKGFVWFTGIIVTGLVIMSIAGMITDAYTKTHPMQCVQMEAQHQ